MTIVPKLKKYSQTTPGGLGITKSGKIQFPYVFKTGMNPDPIINNYGLPYPTIGNWVCNALPSQFLYPSNVGIIIDEDLNNPVHDGSFTIQMLDGKIVEGWRYGAGNLTLQQVSDAKIE